MYAVIRRYEGVQSVDEVVRRVNEGLAPLISQVPGYVSYWGIDAGGGTVASDSSADLVDPRVACDPDAKRVLVCWTRKPATGDRTVAAQVVDGTSLGTLVGAPATVGTGSGEHHDSARVAWNPALKEGMIAWHRDAGSSSYAALCRRVTVAGSSGLAFVGARKEASAGSGAEGMPNVIVLSQAGETAVLWAKTLTFAVVNAYPGSLHGGTWRGRETWIQRYR
jgi:hypothetical protein